MSVEFEPPSLPAPHRVLLLGAATRGWYEADDDTRREQILPRFQTMMQEWRDLGARVLATLDDDLFMVGSPGTSDFTWYLMLELDDLASLTALIQRIRETVDGVRMDKYVRFEARIGRPFFLLERGS
jgi:chlorite dismutase